MALVSDIITGAFEDLAVITVNENITTAMQTDAFNRLNPLLDSLSAEGLTVPNQVMQLFNLVAGTVAYTLGSGGSFATTGGLRAMKVTAWRANYNLMAKGGRVLSMAEFGEAQAAAQASLAELYNRAVQEGLLLTVPSSLSAPIPSIVAADTGYPLINVRVWPSIALTAGQLELAYWTPLANFATVGDALSLPQGFQRMLRCLLAADLYSQYGKPSIKDVIFGNAKDAKDALIEQNAMTAPQPTPAAPQGQK